MHRLVSLSKGTQVPIELDQGLVHLPLPLDPIDGPSAALLEIKDTSTNRVILTCLSEEVTLTIRKPCSLPENLTCGLSLETTLEKGSRLEITPCNPTHSSQGSSIYLVARLNCQVAPQPAQPTQVTQAMAQPAPAAPGRDNINTSPPRFVNIFSPAQPVAVAVAEPTGNIVTPSPTLALNKPSNPSTLLPTLKRDCADTIQNANVLLESSKRTKVTNQEHANPCAQEAQNGRAPALAPAHASGAPRQEAPPTMEAASAAPPATAMAVVAVKDEQFQTLEPVVKPQADSASAPELVFDDGNGDVDGNNTIIDNANDLQVQRERRHRMARPPSPRPDFMSISNEQWELGSKEIDRLVCENTGTLGPANLIMKRCGCRDCSKDPNFQDHVDRQCINLAYIAFDNSGMLVKSGIWEAFTNHKETNGPRALGSKNALNDLMEAGFGPDWERMDAEDSLFYVVHHKIPDSADNQYIILIPRSCFSKEAPVPSTLFPNMVYDDVVLNGTLRVTGGKISCQKLFGKAGFDNGTPAKGITDKVESPQFDTIWFADLGGKRLIHNIKYRFYFEPEHAPPGFEAKKHYKTREVIPLLRALRDTGYDVSKWADLL